MGHKLKSYSTIIHKKLAKINIIFDYKMGHKLKWYSQDGKTANLIDCIIVNQKLAGSIQDTRESREIIFLLGLIVILTVAPLLPTDFIYSST